MIAANVMFLYFAGLSYKNHQMSFLNKDQVSESFETLETSFKLIPEPIAIWQNNQYVLKNDQFIKFSKEK